MSEHVSCIEPSSAMMTDATSFGAEWLRKTIFNMQACVNSDNKHNITGDEQFLQMVTDDGLEIAM